MKAKQIRRSGPWAMLLAAALIVGAPAMAHDVKSSGDDKAAGDKTATGKAADGSGDEAEKSPHCDDVVVTIKNTGEGDIKLINIDRAASGGWSRGPIIFRTISAKGETSWTGNFKDMAGKSVTVRVNTRKVLNVLTDTYSDMISQSVTIGECESKSKHEVSFAG